MVLAIGGASVAAFADASKMEFREVKDYGSSEFECQYTQNQCDEIEMEKDLKAECAQKGFLNCETTVRKKVVLKTGDDYFFCGQWRIGKCIVSVKGSNDDS